METNKIEKEIIQKKILAVNRQVLNTPTQKVIVEIDNDEPIKLGITNEKLALKIQKRIIKKYGSIIRFVRFDDDWTLYFEVSEFDELKKEAINHLLNEIDNDSYFYIKKYNYLLVSEGGKIVGEIFDVVDWQIRDAVKIVRCLCIRFEEINDSFHEMKSVLFGDKIFLKKSNYDEYKYHLSFIN